MKKGYKVKTLKPRCKRVLVILNNKLETVKLVREEIYPPAGDFDTNEHHMAVVDYNIGNIHSVEVYVSIDMVVFLKD